MTTQGVNFNRRKGVNFRPALTADSNVTTEPR